MLEALGCVASRLLTGANEVDWMSSKQALKSSCDKSHMSMTFKAARGLCCGLKGTLYASAAVLPIKFQGLFRLLSHVNVKKVNVCERAREN